MEIRVTITKNNERWKIMESVERIKRAYNLRSSVTIRWLVIKFIDRRRGKVGNSRLPSAIFRTSQLSFSEDKSSPVIGPCDSSRANSTSAAFRFRVISGFDIKAFLSESSDITRSRIQRMANSLLYNIKAIFRVRYRTLSDRRPWNFTRFRAKMYSFLFPFP